MLQRNDPRQTFVRNGNIVYWLAVSLVVLIVVLALTMDGGRMFHERRSLQNASDSAALAAAAKLRTGFCDEPDFVPEATEAALRVAKEFGYDNDNARTNVTVNIPPKSGKFAGKSQYVEVIIEHTQDHSFASAVNSNSATITARAVAHSMRKENGLIILKKNGDNTLLVNGAGEVNVFSAPIHVGSNGSAAYRLTGAARMRGDRHKLVGGAQLAKGAKLIGKVKTNAEAAADSLLCLPEPNLADYIVREVAQLKIAVGEVVLNPGIYIGGVRIEGTGDLTMKPGMYIMDGGGFHHTSSGDLFADGVTIYNRGGLLSGGIKIGGSGNVSITAPKSGTYAGVSIFQARNLAETIEIDGRGNSRVEGVIYAPKGHVKLSALGTDLTTILGGAYITNTMEINANGSFRIGAALKSPTAASIRLVE